MRYPFKNPARVCALSLVLLSFACRAHAADVKTPLRITDIKMAYGVDREFKAERPAQDFPFGTPKVYCWFEWKEAETGSQIVVKWTYLNEKVSVLNYTFPIPRREGSGGVALAMPEGKPLPTGEYEVRLESDKGTPLKSLKFKVLKK